MLAGDVCRLGSVCLRAVLETLDWEKGGGGGEKETTLHAHQHLASFTVCALDTLIIGTVQSVTRSPKLWDKLQA